MTIDTTHTVWPVCPHCGHVHKDAWEWRPNSLEFDDDWQCERCDKTFMLSRHTSITYTTTEPKT
jgi:transposase-like protein